MSLLDVFAPAKAIADAVLYEGYILYPYRASADKNRVRWQWGVVGPTGARADGVGEEPTMSTDLVVEGGDATVRLRLRFLQVVSRRVERVEAGQATKVETVTIDGETFVSFDDAEERMAEVIAHVGTPGAAATTVGFSFDECTETESLGTAAGAEHRLVRHQESVSGEVTVRPEAAGDDVHVVHVEIRNTTDWGGGDRDAANLRSLVGAHVIGAVTGGLFVSTLEPPPEHAEAVGQCTAHRLWPVLVGATGRASLVLASPVILYDQPEIAPESGGSFFDGLEIDEMLSLRVKTMTDVEKAEARATDPRAAAIVDRVDAMLDEEWVGLHGTIRSGDGRPFANGGDDALEIPTIVGDGTSGETAEELTGGKPWWDPGVDERFDPDTDAVVVAGEPISRGSVVQLHPGKRADAHDIFYRDRVATVAAIIHDVDGSIHVAVTIDDDPAADLNDATGRYLYFSPDEVEPLGRRVDR